MEGQAPEAQVEDQQQQNPPEEGMFVWGQEDDAQPIELIAARTEIQSRIAGTPVIKTSDDPEKTSIWFEVLFEPVDYPTAGLITDRLFFPEAATEPRRRNEQLNRLNDFKACFGWTPPVGEVPEVGTEFPELQEAIGNFRVGIEKDRSGQYPDKNRVQAYLPAVA